MTAPQNTPLILVSELAARTGQSTDTNKTNLPALRTAIVQASDYLQRLSRYRFDERLDTRYYTALPESVGGDLLGPFDLILDEALRSLTSLYILGDRFVSDAGTLVSSGYLLNPANKQNGVQVYTRISLNPQGSTVFTGAQNPGDSISVTGLWGYGGQWADTGTTLNGAISSTSATTFTSSAGASLEAGMMLKADSEQMYVESISSNTITVTRGCNGTTAATHLTGATVYRWQSQDSVQNLMTRILMWRAEQDKAPLFGQVTVGDITFPVDVSSTPKDIIDNLKFNGLYRPQKVRAL